MFMCMRDAPTFDDALIFNRVCAEAELVVPETIVLRLWRACKKYWFTAASECSHRGFRKLLVA